MVKGGYWPHDCKLHTLLQAGHSILPVGARTAPNTSPCCPAFVRYRGARVQTGPAAAARLAAARLAQTQHYCSPCSSLQAAPWLMLLSCRAPPSCCT